MAVAMPQGEISETVMTSPRATLTTMSGLPPDAEAGRLFMD
jgi:hypothetical protein